MNIVDLLSAVGKLGVVTWKRREGACEFVRISRRTEGGRIVLDHQRPEDGAWDEDPNDWDVDEFLRVFEPVR